MNRLQPCRHLVLLACLVLAAPALGAGTEPASPPPAGLAEARDLVQRGKYDEALAILRPLAQGASVDANAAFQFGLAAVGAAQRRDIAAVRRTALLDEAIAAFRAMLVTRPGLVRVRLELARAFFLKDEDGLAKRHFEQVLAGNPPAAVALNVSRFLGIMRARKRWSLRLGVAVAPDTNIGAGSDERFIYIFGLPFRRNQEELTTSGVGISAWLGGEYQYPLGKPGTEGNRWRLRAGGNLSRKEYRASDFDRLTVSGHVGPRWLIGRASEASLLLSGLHEWTGSGIENPSHRDIGLRVEGRHRIGRRTTLNAAASRHERRYRTRTDLDGPIADVSVGANWVASPTLRIDASMGWGRVRTETERERHSRHWVRTGFTQVLPFGFTVGGSATLRWSDYEGNWFPFTPSGMPRRDLVRSLRLSVHNRAFAVWGFSPEISLTQEQRTSNAQIHGYERISGELRLVRLF